jgi:peptidoglycan/LPS O-acetylase OafA/YrhL
MPIAQKPLHNPELGPAPPTADAARPAWLPAYIPELDGLRGVAVLAVVIYHCHPLLAGSWIDYASRWGWAGVNLFFVLSGFLITSILIESSGKPHYFRNFYARRALRIWPVYVLLLIVCYSVPDWFLGDTLANQTQLQTLAAYAFFVQNLRHTALPGTLGPTWSLAIEEQFYFVWAPLVLLSLGAGFARIPLRRFLLPVVLAAMLVVSPLIRFLHPHWLTGTHTLIHLDGIAMGSLLALGLYHLRISRPIWLGIGLTAAVIGLWATATIAAGTSFLDTALALAFVGIVLTALTATGARHPAMWLLRRGPLPFYGKISYGLYMIHILVFVYFGSFGLLGLHLDQRGIAGNLAIAGLRLIASTTVATALWYGFESQILRLKRRF